MNLIDRTARPGHSAGLHPAAGIGLAHWHAPLPRLGIALGVCLLLASSGVSAQVFKWVGPDGKTNYSDVPPPPSAQRAQKKAFAGNVVDGGDLPFSVAEVAKTSPVTLHTGAKCAPCDEGRKLLGSRGIPFTEKTVSSNADIATLGTGGVELPQLSVGGTKLRGFEPGAWNASLSAAGYPESNSLPKSYRNPAPQSAAPASRDTPAKPTTSADAGDNAVDASPASVGRKPAPRNQPKAPDANPAGIRF